MSDTLWGGVLAGLRGINGVSCVFPSGILGNVGAGMGGVRAFDDRRIILAVGSLAVTHILISSIICF